MGFDCWRPICPLDLQTICHNERYMTHVFINPDHAGTNRVFRASFETFMKGISCSCHKYVEDDSVNGLSSLPYLKSCET